ncbi:hypothetical protein LTR64_007134 [Lithohypha guttulata]|uniref:uncharacterized protein n=1 Tax=Lithohypha guttulata TaxID=1690604 RepID=UPI00315CEC93
MDSQEVSESRSKKKRKNKKKGTTTASVSTAPREPQTTEHTSKAQAEDDSDTSIHDQEESDAQPADTSAATSIDDETMQTLVNGTDGVRISDDMAAATARFDALVRDRDALRDEVTRLRQNLEEVQRNHDEQLADVRNELEAVQGERETAEENYQNLLGKVNTIRSQLGERLKADAEDLAQARTKIDELEEQRSEIQENYTLKAKEVEDLATRNSQIEEELAEIRERSTLSQQNWVKERQELQEQQSYWREEFDQAKQAMHDWEVLAMEERSIRRDLSDRASDLEEQLANLQRDYDRAIGDRDTQASAVDGLQRAMQEIQNARKKELREVVESSQNEVADLRKTCDHVKAELKATQDTLKQVQADLDRALPFEKEVKEKNLLIGKLRHEAVILNDHLTKALRFLKKGKPEDNVDRSVNLQPNLSRDTRTDEPQTNCNKSPPPLPRA